MILKSLIKQVKPGEIEKVFIGTFTTAVISRFSTELRCCGLASTLREVCGENNNHPGPHPKVRNSGKMEGMQTSDLAEYVLSENLLEASIGMAAINSALPAPACRFAEINASELIIEHGRGKNVAVIGHFPFVNRLKEQVRKLTVFEKRLRPGDMPSQKMPEILPQADVVAVSGTTLMNHTFEEIIKLCKSTAYKIMLGPSAPLSPVLFEYGIDAVSGTIVENTELLLRYLCQGANFQGLQGKKLVTMQKREAVRHSETIKG